MGTRLDSLTVLTKYGRRAYHVHIAEEHWGNVAGYDDGWTAVWFTSPADSKAKFGGSHKGFRTRAEAAAEVRIQTIGDRCRWPARV